RSASCPPRGGRLRLRRRDHRDRSADLRRRDPPHRRSRGRDPRPAGIGRAPRGGRPEPAAGGGPAVSSPRRARLPAVRVGARRAGRTQPRTVPRGDRRVPVRAVGRPARLRPLRRHPPRGAALVRVGRRGDVGGRLPRGVVAHLRGGDAPSVGDTRRAVVAPAPGVPHRARRRGRRRRRRRRPRGSPPPPGGALPGPGRRPPAGAERDRGPGGAPQRPRPHPPPPGTAPGRRRGGVASLQPSGVTKTFGDPPVPALEGIDFTAETGTFTAIVGASGSGKSTLLRIVAGMTEPDAGEVTMGGRTPDELRRGKEVGWMAQRPALLPWRRVRDNIALAQSINPRPDRELPSPDELLEMVGLSHVAGSYPRELSGGMQQRVALARTLAIGAPLWLMDEPFSALDELTREALAEDLLRLWQQV